MVAKDMKLRRLAGVAVVAAMAAGAASRSGAEPAPSGWSFVGLPQSQSYARLYVPPGLDRSKPAPLVLFLHGTGVRPNVWEPYLPAPADAAGTVVIAPYATATASGWGNPGDEEVLAEALAEAKQRVLIDPRRTSIAGHSAGGAYAYLIAYQTLQGRLPRFSAVFSMAAPYVFVDHLQDPAYVAPIRMYYGGLDPNFLSGKRDALVAQWQRLGVPFEEDLQPGYGHASWPPSTLLEAFAFLARQTYPGFSSTCSPDAYTLCLREGRYRAAIAWRTAAGSGSGHAVPLASGDSGLFWFFGAGNIEMLIKVLDGCAENHHVWVFASATTNVEFTLEVTDTVSGAVRRYDNASGHPASIVIDTDAFTTCP